MCCWLLLLGSLPLQADQLVTSAELSRLGLYSHGFRLLQVSHNGKRVLGLERTRASERRRGLTQRLWVLELEPELKAEGYPLLVPEVNDATFLPDESGVVIVTQAGATLAHFDLASRRLRFLTAPSLNDSGFVARPGTLRRFNQALLVVGEFYSPGAPAGNSRLALVQPELDPPFLPGLELEVEFLQPSLTEWSYPEGGFLVLPSTDGQWLARWHGGNLSRLVEVKRVTGLAAAGNRALATVVNWEGQAQALLVEEERVSSLVSQPESLGYPLVSEQAESALFCQLNLMTNRLSVVVSRRREGYLNYPLPGLQEVPLGQLLLSGDGQTVIYHNGGDLRRISVPVRSDGRGGESRQVQKSRG